MRALSRHKSGPGAADIRRGRTKSVHAKSRPGRCSLATPLLVMAGLADAAQDTRPLDAARAADSMGVITVLEQGASANTHQADRATALHWADDVMADARSGRRRRRRDERIRRHAALAGLPVVLPPTAVSYRPMLPPTQATAADRYSTRRETSLASAPGRFEPIRRVGVRHSRCAGPRVPSGILQIAPHRPKTIT